MTCFLRQQQRNEVVLLELGQRGAIHRILKSTTPPLVKRNLWRRHRHSFKICSRTLTLSTAPGAGDGVGAALAARDGPGQLLRISTSSVETTVGEDADHVGAGA